MHPPFDVAIVGSGPSGALAALKLVERGRNVLLLDVGNDDDRYRKLIPDEPFSQLRRSDPEQRRYFLGDRLEGIPRGQVRVGAQLTPPRQFVTLGVEEHLPVSGWGFDPMQSLALGGLGAAWGAASFTYSRRELERAGIYEPGFLRYYEEVSQTIGISAEPGDDSSRDCFSGVAHHLPALDLDSVATCMRSRYLAKRESFLRDGFSLGRTPLAVLSRDFAGRRANPYFDMDFWSESRQSVFRPRYLIERLMKRPNFRLERGRLVTRFEDEGPLGVAIRCKDLDRGTTTSFRARRLLLCAGAINSARIALNSLGLIDQRVPILCNPYTYVPCVYWPILGREVADRRHSLSQLVAIYKPEEAAEEVMTAQFYSYRSLLLFKLVKEIPLPPLGRSSDRSAAGEQPGDRGDPPLGFPRAQQEHAASRVGGGCIVGAAFRLRGIVGRGGDAQAARATIAQAIRSSWPDSPLAVAARCSIEHPLRRDGADRFRRL